jgi:hypothetical protein
VGQHLSSTHLVDLLCGGCLQLALKGSTDSKYEDKFVAQLKKRKAAGARVEVETQEKGNIGNKPGFFACFVSKKQ